jgi:ParB family chromosome partitioning protein
MNKPLDKQRKVLGKGLSALLPQRPVLPAQSEPEAPPSGPSVNTVAIDLIDPNPVQPRTIFEPAKLDELATSIQANGIIQPLILRRKGDRYELVAGERRLRASKLANLTEVPAVIQDYADETLLQIALVENIQREDLNPIETAHALDRLARDLNLSHEEIGRRTGKDRTTVTNLLRLLKLPKPVQLLIAEHRLSMGHARAVLGLPDPDQQIQMAERTAAQGYSVRQVERLVKEATEHRANAHSATVGGAPQPPPKQDPNVTAAVRDLESALGTRVRIVDRDGQRGTIHIEYYSQDDLNRIYELLMGTGAKPD